MSLTWNNKFEMMMNIKKSFFLISGYIKKMKYSPLIFSYLFYANKNRLVEMDLDAALIHCKWYKKKNRLDSFVNYICYLPEYRILYMYRLGVLGKILLAIYCNRILLYIGTSDIGGGIFFQHGFSSIVEAEKIGENCQIWHNVTIGKKKSGEGRPIIGNNVLISTGACVLGDIHIGNNVTIGANAVVIHDVPDNCIAVGVPARVKKKLFYNNIFS